MRIEKRSRLKQKKYQVIGFAVVLVAFSLLIINSTSVPEYMTVKGTLRNSTGSLLSGNYNITFRIYNDSSSGALKWSETQEVNVSTGVYYAILGSENHLNVSFDEDYWLSLEINSDGEMSPRQRLTSSPYALRSNRTEGLVCVNCINSTQIASVGWDKVINEPTLLSNFTDDLGNRGYTALSNFTDDLGNRGYTALSNFTDDLGNRGYTHLGNFTDDVTGKMWYVNSGQIKSNATTTQNVNVTGNLTVTGNIYMHNQMDYLFDSAGIIKEKYLPYCPEEITSDVYTNGQNQETGCDFGVYSDYYNISNLVPSNIKSGMEFGRGETGTLSPDGNASESNCSVGTTFYSGDSWTQKTGSAECVQSSNPSAAIIKSDNYICGVSGTLSPSGTATAGDVCGSKTFYSGGSWTQKTGSRSACESCVSGTATTDKIKSGYTADIDCDGVAETGTLIAYTGPIGDSVCIDALYGQTYKNGAYSGETVAQFCNSFGLTCIGGKKIRSTLYVCQSTIYTGYDTWDVLVTCSTTINTEYYIYSWGIMCK